MSRHPFAFALVAFLLLVSGVAQEPASPERMAISPFRSIVKPQGWELPKHRRAKSRKLFVAPAGQPKVTRVYVSEFGSSQPMFLPWYYIENDRLMLYSFKFRLPTLLMFEVDGKPFRYTAAAVGSHIGASANATWTDRDGDGTFEEFRWASSPTEDLPKWIKVASTTDKSSGNR